jgi:uncharacterized protein YeaO (DUF488 family)
MLKTKRVYEAPEASDGIRILVDRIWPRGATKAEAKLKYWMPEIAPSSELRKWYSHEPRKWRDFKMKYFEELDSGEKQKAIKKIANMAKKKKVTLIYSAKEERMNQAEAIRQYIDRII